MTTISAFVHSRQAKRLSFQRAHLLVVGAVLAVALTAAVLLVRPAAPPIPVDSRSVADLSLRTHDSWAVENRAAVSETKPTSDVGQPSGQSLGAAAGARTAELSPRTHDDWALQVPAAQALDVSPRAHDNWMFAAPAAPSLDVSMRSHDDWPLEVTQSITLRQP